MNFIPVCTWLSTVPKMINTLAFLLWLARSPLSLSSVFGSNEKSMGTASFSSRLYCLLHTRSLPRKILLKAGVSKMILEKLFLLVNLKVF